MNITTIIELENAEVEKMSGAKLIFAQNEIEENIIETCVEYLQVEDTKEILTPDEAMEKVFYVLKKEGIIPNDVEDFSFEMPSCGFIKNYHSGNEIPQKVILTFER